MLIKDAEDSDERPCLKRLSLGQELGHLWCFYLAHASFLPALRQNTSIEELEPIELEIDPTFGPGLLEYFVQHTGSRTIELITEGRIILARNRSIRHAKSLLAL